MRRRPGLRLLALLALLAIGLAGRDAQSAASPAESALPPDPEDWVCQDTPPTPETLEAWCRANPFRGFRAPAFLSSPPPLGDLLQKNVFDELFQGFLRRRAYATDLRWKRDVGWRLTGPYVGAFGSGQSYGVHPAVRIFYSPEMTDWLCGGRTGPIPDGATIIKEMRSIDASLDIAVDADRCMTIQAKPGPAFWSVMIKAAGASRDGWYWGSYNGVPQPPVSASSVGNPPVFDRSGITGLDFYGGASIPLAPNPLWYPTGYVYESPTKIPDVVYPGSLYGGACINCHASAERQSTFVTLDNVLGPGLRYKHFDAGPSPALPLGTSGYVSPFARPLPRPAPDFLALYDQMGAVPFGAAWRERMPAETWDHVVAAARGPNRFLTSDQCQACHDATYSNAALPNMLYPVPPPGGAARLVNLSPYGEWRASPMGLAGRDPVFFAQLQSETNNLPAHTTCIENTCLHCHGVMGERQLAIDTPGQGDPACQALFPIPPPPEVPSGRSFQRQMVGQWSGAPHRPELRYGALARDGISCAVCHSIAATDLGRELTFTGNFVTGPATELYGPYPTDTVVPKPMEHAVGITPLFAGQIRDSNLCGSCHNVLLPVFDNAGRVVSASYEQSTHLEWTNSDFAPGRSTPRSCQDCHMPTSFKGQPLAFQIANVESDGFPFPPTTNRLPDDQIRLTTRTRFARHSMHGLNVFLNEMFQQFPLILGIRQIDTMTGTAAEPSLITGRNSMLDMARDETASVDVQAAEKIVDGLRVVVLVTNKAGHYLPSGVGFRRVFLEVLVSDAGGALLWASGRTNRLGFILDGTTDEVLASEQPVRFPQAPFQPHYQRIERGDQVQIYQELMEDSAGNLTTSFLRRVAEVKDNRIRPRGFDPAVFAANPSPYIQKLAELPGDERSDPYYTDPALTGADQIEYAIALDAQTLARAATVRVSLYSQSIPPFYLQDRFRDASRGTKRKDDIERLYHLTSHLDVNAVMDELGRPALRDWKLLIAAPATRAVE